MRILFITDPYPSDSYPNNGVFVYSFVQELCRQGHSVSVITPGKNIFQTMLKKKVSYGLEKATVYSYPVYTASSKKIGSFNTYSITHWQKVRVVKKALNEISVEFDIVYCHFISTLLYAAPALKGIDKPIFVAVGENKNIDNVKSWYSEIEYFESLNKATGFIAVSQVIKDKLEKKLGISPDKILLAPNGTDLSLYRPKDRKIMRRKFGFPENDFIAIFVGRFLHNKGPLRIIQAMHEIEDSKMIFVGSGPQHLNHPNIIFNDKVPRQQIPELLSCADAFVLPTLHEGSNNAIIEAMACGLPIISSDIPEVRAQCDKSFAILVDPMSINEIHQALIEIKCDTIKAKTMSDNALLYALNFDIGRRAKRILDFIQYKIDGIK